MHRPALRALSVSVLSVALVVLASARASAGNDGLPCGRRLVSLGEPTSAVLQRCGEPHARTSRVEARVFRGRTVYVTVEEWTYRRGSRDFPRLATFENGRLVSVEALSN